MSRIFNSKIQNIIIINDTEENTYIQETLRNMENALSYYEFNVFYHTGDKEKLIVDLSNIDLSKTLLVVNILKNTTPIPILETPYYLLINVQDQSVFSNCKKIIFEELDFTKNMDEYTKKSDYHYYEKIDEKTYKACCPYGTHISSNEIKSNFLKLKNNPIQKDNEEYIFIGVYNNEVLQKINTCFVNTDIINRNYKTIKMDTTITNKKYANTHNKLIYYSPIEKKNNLPSNLLYLIANGCIGITNNYAANIIFGNDILYQDNTVNLLDNIDSYVNNFQLHTQIKNMQIIAKEHTLKKRFEFLFFLIGQL